MSDETLFGMKMLRCGFMPPDEMMIASERILRLSTSLCNLVEARVITEGEAEEELVLFMLREQEKGRQHAYLYTKVGSKG